MNPGAFAIVLIVAIAVAALEVEVEVVVVVVVVVAVVAVGCLTTRSSPHERFSICTQACNVAAGQAKSVLGYCHSLTGVAMHLQQVYRHVECL